MSSRPEHGGLRLGHGALFQLALGIGLLAGLLMLPAGCGEDRRPIAFDSTDISGADLGPDFNFGLRDPAGQVRRLADFRGRVVVLFFGFTHCPDVCPTALSRFAAIKRLLGEDGQRLEVVFITLDPDRDTPPLLARYVQSFDPAFVSLRGDAAATRQAAEAFHIYFRRVDSGSSYTLDHSVLSYVFDGQGKARLLLRPDQDMRAVLRDLKLLIDTTTSRT